VQATLEELVWDKLAENSSKKRLLVSYLPVYIKEINKEGSEPLISEDWEAFAREGRNLARRSSI
jgi:hypothetical protein